MKFNVGDKVRVIKLDNDFITREPYIGKEGLVLDTTGLLYPYTVDIPVYEDDEPTTLWLESELEEISE